MEGQQAAKQVAALADTLRRLQQQVSIATTLLADGSLITVFSTKVMYYLYYLYLYFFINSSRPLFLLSNL